MKEPRGLPDADATLAQTLALMGSLAVSDAGRRRALRALGAAGVAAIAGAAASPLAALTCAAMPEITAGPFPGDGSNGPNVLKESGIVRSDIRASFGSAGSTVASGAPVKLVLQLSDARACTPLAGRAVYLWHCDANGGYSLYSPDVVQQNFLRGVQASDAAGQLAFTTVYPGCYPGRWPHMHFEVYASVTAAGTGEPPLRTSQLALPESLCREVYAQSARYPGSLARLARMSMRSDFLFADGGALLIPSVSGDPATGWTLTLPVGLG
jgi:protocatechuate 3,4-dioxygenase beta subunit